MVNAFDESDGWRRGRVGFGHEVVVHRHVADDI